MMLEYFRLITERFGASKAPCSCANMPAATPTAARARAFRANVGKAATPAEFYDVVEKYFPREDVPAV